MNGDPYYLGASLTPQIPTEGPIQNVQGIQAQAPIPGLGGAPNKPSQQSNAAANPESGWPDALIGLSKFLIANRRQRQQAPAPQSFAGIGQPASSAAVGKGPRGRTI